MQIPALRSNLILGMVEEVNQNENKYMYLGFILSCGVQSKGFSEWIHKLLRWVLKLPFITFASANLVSFTYSFESNDYVLFFMVLGT